MKDNSISLVTDSCVVLVYWAIDNWLQSETVGETCTIEVEHNRSSLVIDGWLALVYWKIDNWLQSETVSLREVSIVAV